MTLDAHSAAAQAWRDPTGVAAWWQSPAVPAELLISATTGPWWELLAQMKITLILSREYENFLLALTVVAGEPRQSWLPLPHPSGIAVDRKNGTVYAACTRNPNQIVQLRSATAAADRDDCDPINAARQLLPTRTDFLPGCTYLHDLVWDDGRLLANAVGMNAVVEIRDQTAIPLWWPASIETDGVPDFRRNHLQLNSIALRDGLAGAAFSASTAKIGKEKPGQPDFPVDGCGVIFDAETREPAITGLTRPHSARFHQDRLWLNNSGYGQFGFADYDRGRLQTVACLPGWTRGMMLIGDIAFVGTSRVLPRFSHYAPGLDPARCCCGISAIDLKTGATLARIEWPHGNQIFAIEAIDCTVTTGFPLTSHTTDEQLRTLFYTATAAAANLESS